MMENQSSSSSSSPYPYPEYVMRMIGNQSISKKARIDCESRRDLLSELPLSIIHVILALVPFRDAVGTSLLSRQWRYTWTSLPYLIFEDKGDSRDRDEMYRFEERVQTIITHALFRHNGPIQKFKMSVPFRLSRPNIDAWVHYLSRNGIGELSLKMAYDNMVKMLSSIYSCNKLTYLELVNCMVDPPPSTFEGFLFLKCLILREVSLSPDGIETLVAKSPLLDRFELTKHGNPKLQITAPNLKYATLRGSYTKICLYAPLLVEMSVGMSDLYFTPGHLQQKTSVCNYTSFFGGVTNLEKLTGYINFIKHLSIGIESCHHSVVLHHLKVIKLYHVKFDDITEVSTIVRLISGAPNLQELEIITIGTAGGDDALEAPAFKDFGCAPKLRAVYIFCASGLPLLMKFIEFLLECSPVLEMMTVALSNGFRIEEEQNLRQRLLGCSRASADAKLFVR